MLGLKALKGIKTQHLSRVNALDTSTELLGLRFFAAAAPNNMALIKQLREQTGAPIADVKSALQAADWDLEKASQELRKKGLAAASKKASRHAAEGLVGIATSPTAAAIVEINSETDFVARNDQFKELVSSAAASLLHNTSSAAGGGSTAEVPTSILEATAMSNNSGSPSVADAVADVAGSVRENIKLRRGYHVSVPYGSSGTLGTYIHGGIAPGLGRIASLVLLQHPEPSTTDSATQMQDLAHKLALHVVGAVPKYLNRAEVPDGALEGEKKLLTEQAAQSGKPQNIIEKMVQGRLSKFYEEACLLEQPFIMDDKKKVKDVVKEAATTAKMNVELVGYLRVQVGEGLEEEKKDFAAEVAETLSAAASK
jgi:elongation factor Ts